jgi:flagellar basal-body rod protein FlgF
MESPIYIGLSRQVALRRQLDVVANNIANMNTSGFRAERMLFEAALEPGGKRPTDRIAYTIDRSTYTDFRQGGFKETGNPYDVAIDGDGWLSVQTPDGVRYTRDGRLSRAGDGQLVTVNGHPVLDDNLQPILIPDERSVLAIASDGVVSADDELLARLRLVRFDQPQTLRQTGDLLFTTDSAPQPALDSRLVQGRIEQSNVQGIVEMTRMMDLSRDYQSVSRMVEEGQNLLQSAINRLGKTQ